MMETVSISLLPLMPILLSTSLLFPSIKNPSTIIFTFLLIKIGRRITTSTKTCYWKLHATTITISTTTTTTITNNPNSRTSSVDTPSPIIIHDYGANSSGDYLFQNCSQPKVTAGGGEGSAGGSGGSTNSIHHQHVLVKEVVLRLGFLGNGGI
ncbi:hypothetical protein AHAS_Ahas16G0288300 [Arachis hypogaea]